MLAVSRNGEALPWYTYPCIDFLKYRSYKDKSILEFGAGQSTLWWANRARRVVSMEGDIHWLNTIKPNVPINVELHLVSVESPTNCVQDVNKALDSYLDSKFDVIVIDGLYRFEMIEIACRVLADTGIIVCDNSEGYGIYDGFKERGLNRVDFFGNAPGVILPHCTSIFFQTTSFVFSPFYSINVIAEE